MRVRFKVFSSLLDAMTQKQKDMALEQENQKSRHTDKALGVDLVQQEDGPFAADVTLEKQRNGTEASPYPYTDELSV